MRNLTEITFRLRQEAHNLALLLKPPHALTSVRPPLPGLPPPDSVIARLRTSAFCAELRELADRILERRVPLLGRGSVPLPDAIDWRRDYIHGRSSGAQYFRRIPYLDFDRVGDHKNVWELNRHQHLVVLAQAFRLTGSPAYLSGLQEQLWQWMEANPFQRGINWASALEVAFRALSWVWIYHLAGENLDARVRRRFLVELYRHGCHLRHNLSIYFSPNTHLLGEAVALHALGALFPDWPEATEWKSTGARIVLEQLETQVLGDGAHFERSSYYHLYALDMFLFHAILSNPGPSYRDTLARMAVHLDALMGPQRSLPLLGDDDGGRFFHPYGERHSFGRATLATCAVLLDRPTWSYEGEDLACQAAWWVGERAILPDAHPAPPLVRSRLFRDAGVAACCHGRVHLVFDAGPFGARSSGHSHSDTLSFVLRHCDEEILVDAGTFTYVSDPVARDWFRGSAAHNTIRIDGLDQGAPAGPFQWRAKPCVSLAAADFTPERDFIDASCSYAGFRHRRRLLWVKPNYILVLDRVEGPDGDHVVEQFWHPGGAVVPAEAGFRLGSRAVLFLPDGEIHAQRDGENGWRSRALGHKEEAWAICRTRRGPLPMTLASAIDLTGGATGLSLEGPPGRPAIAIEGFPGVCAEFPDAGVPRYCILPSSSL